VTPVTSATESKYTSPIDPLHNIALSFLYRTRLRKQLLLLDQYGSAVEAWRHLDEPGMDEAMERAKQECEWMEAHGIRVWTLEDEDYPIRLRQCADRPTVLYSKGKVDLGKGHFVSIVGTRRPTERGKELTSTLVRELHEQLEQVTIISGGAYGIDIAAHRAAIECGIPTIIVPAHGLDRIYPQVHRQDAIKALEHGGLLTEFMSGTEPMAPYFVQRNRIVAGLSDATVVVESRERGGSLITARMAIDYDRALFAFPGRPNDESSRGCNQLIYRTQAQLIDSAEDLINAMEWTTRTAHKVPVQTQLVGLMDELTASQKVLFEKIQEAEEGMHINHLVMETEMPYGDVSSDLMMMEMQGLIRALPGGFYRIKNN
jgi:DNA processing protein